MNVLFLTLSSNIDINDSQSIYGSLLYELVKTKNNVYVVSPTERRNGERTYILDRDYYHVLKVKTGNIQKTNVIEKGISTVLIEGQFKRAIKKYYRGIKFDLILYATPPITLYNVIKYVKKRDRSKTYLMLKDIFPQNAVDMKMFSNRSLFYFFFRNKEKKLYRISDRIGCMSPKNKEYLLKNNKYLKNDKIEVFPNSITPCEEYRRNYELNKKYRKKYGIPLKSRVFMYGGNLGKPQGIPFIIDCVNESNNIENVFFIVCGTGTEYRKIEEFKNKTQIKNFILINGLPKKEYSELLNVADVGLIFLDYNFTIPNFPSRLLSYMEKGIPVLSCTDLNTDIGEIIEKNSFGWKCYSNNCKEFKSKIRNISRLDKKTIEEYGNNALEFISNNYSSEKNIKNILKLCSK